VNARHNGESIGFSRCFGIWLAAQPEIALFESLALGFFIGPLKFGPIQLGGVCGTLIVAPLLGQSGARVSPDLKDIAFAPFIFALGFTGEPLPGSRSANPAFGGGLV
jgi:hypothetical protein